MEKSIVRESINSFLKAVFLRHSLSCSNAPECLRRTDHGTSHVQKKQNGHNKHYHPNQQIVPVLV